MQKFEYVSHNQKKKASINVEKETTQRTRGLFLVRKSLGERNFKHSYLFLSKTKHESYLSSVGERQMVSIACSRSMAYLYRQRSHKLTIPENTQTIKLTRKSIYGHTETHRLTHLHPTLGTKDGGSKDSLWLGRETRLVN